MDRNQFSEFYDENIQRVFRFIYLRVDTAETAQDLTSLVFLKFWQRQTIQKEKQSKKVLNPKAFLFQIARNQIIDFYREKSKKPLSLDYVGEIADFQIAKQTFIQKIELNFEMERIKKALLKINPLYADIIIWRYVNEMPNKEIAQILKKKEGNVRVILHRAMESLKKELE
ncbi:MAG: RNA polymerase sigma factor [Candidatus Pacebacteria bacterium]|nr:RNA polymerase sigma factor [Candidatus Paceibacterota bacterium]MDD5721936.1 RNA polymerase sigma factor [Candidatus Paceibacterota bacterium]